MSDLATEPHRHRPLLIVLSGPSGVGKDSVVRGMKARKAQIAFVVTMTDRPPRKEEVDGEDYFFVSREYFQQLIDNGGLIEYAWVYGQLKGVPRAQVHQAIESGQDVIMRLDVQGAARIHELYPQAVLIFLTAESKEALRQRLLMREKKISDDIELRIRTAQAEMERVSEYDYVVINRDQHLDEAVESVLSIIRAEHCRVNHRQVSV